MDALIKFFEWAVGGDFWRFAGCAMFVGIVATTISYIVRVVGIVVLTMIGVKPSKAAAL